MGGNDIQTTLRGRMLSWRSGQLVATDPLSAWQGLLRVRGLNEQDAFFSPHLRDLPDPDAMQDMSKAAGRLAEAVLNSENIHIFGDFDCDGVCGAAMLADLLGQAGARVSVSIPHRVSEGHGIDPQAVEKAHQAGSTLGISVDTGTCAFDAAEAASRCGMDLIITDHHLPDTRLPDAYAVLNPARGDCGFADRVLCGTAVAFLLLISAWKHLRQKEMSPPDLKAALDRVAIATVADVMPLTGINRILVHQGLQRIRQSPCAGVAALLALSKKNKTVDSENVRFQLAPRINAAGRMDHGEHAMRLLSTHDASVAAELATELNACNRDRQKVERETLALVEESLAETGRDVLAAYGEAWHAGVVGLVAGRLARKHAKPAAVGFIEPSGNIRISLRGTPGFHIGRILEACAGYLLSYGGHAGAGGAAMQPDQWKEFVLAFDAAVHEGGKSGTSLEPLLVDGVLQAGAIHPGLVQRLELLQPCGEGNPESLWCLEGMRIVNRQQLRGDVLRLRLSAGAQALSAVAFRAADLNEALQFGAELRLLGHLRFDAYRGGDAIQFVVKDVASNTCTIS